MDPGRFFDPDQPLTTSAGAQAVNVSSHAVRKWRTRGYLDPQGERHWLPVIDYDEHGNPRHRYADLVNAEKATSTTPTGRPRTLGAPDELPALGGRLREADWATLNCRSA